MSAPLLSILLNHPDEWPAVADQIHAEMFTPDLRPIFVAYQGMASEGLKPDAIMVSDALGDNEHAQDALQRVIDDFSTAHSLEGHVKALRDAWRKREAHKIGNKLSSGLPLDDAMQELARLQVGTQRGIDGASLRGAVFEEVVANASADFIGLSTGLTDLDAKLCGLRGQSLTILAARPGMGKTALMLNIAQAQKTPVAIFSLEMSAVDLGKRLVAATGVDYGKIESPRQFRDEFAPLTAGMKGIPEGLRVYDRGGQSISEIEAECYRLHSSTGLSLAIVDYLQLVTVKAESRLEVVSEVSRRLKSMAKNLDIPVIALCQLNRAVDNRADRRPVLSDLRESGQIEQDADKVVFIYRPTAYEDTATGDDVLVVAKNRQGQTGTVPVRWDGKHQRFQNAAQHWGQP